MKRIKTSKAPAVVGPYSQAIEANGMVFCAGQIGIDPTTGTLLEGIEHQTKQVMKNLHAVLTEAGTDFNRVIKTTIFLSDMKNYGTVNELYGQYFSENKPARSTVAVKELPKKALIEIEVIAII